MKMRSQEERVRTFHEQFDRLAQKYELGHCLMLMEIMVDGKPVIATLANHELGDAPGIHDLPVEEGEQPKTMLRAEEMLLEEYGKVLRCGFGKIEPGKDFAILPGYEPVEVPSIVEYLREFAKNPEASGKDGESLSSIPEAMA